MIAAVREVTHIAPADPDGTIIGEPLLQASAAAATPPFVVASTGATRWSRSPRHEDVASTPVSRWWSVSQSCQSARVIVIAHRPLTSHMLLHCEIWAPHFV